MDSLLRGVAEVVVVTVGAAVLALVAAGTTAAGAVQVGLIAGAVSVVVVYLTSRRFDEVDEE